jgi:response regulator RpfG family c-di-GMP phosphodiesterase
MATRPEDRFPTPEAVYQALLPWVSPARQPVPQTRDSDHGVEVVVPSAVHHSATRVTSDRPSRVLVVDDEPGPRELCSRVLQASGIDCDEASSGLEALEVIRTKPYDLVLLDVNMPDLNGLEVCRKLRQEPLRPHLKIITMSGLANPDDLASMLLAGADDFLSKPFSVVQLQARVKAALRLKSAQDRSDLLNEHLLILNTELQKSLRASDSSLVETRNALVLTLARLVEQREGMGVARLTRLQNYTRLLATEAAHLPEFASVIDESFIDRLVCAAPLLDIGKLGLPDHILLKPGHLTADERLIMQTHTVIGADLLQSVAQQYGAAQPFLDMAITIARHHHERWDGSGYPDRLAGSAIPLSARLVAPCDVYDALRSRRLYRPGLSHAAALQVMGASWGSQFDPALRQPFLNCADRFAKLFRSDSE